MVSKNHSPTGNYIARVRNYKSGVLHFLTWDNVGLSVKWQTKKQSGAIVGYALADVDNDGAKELVIASVTKQKAPFIKPRSQVVVYEVK